MVQKKSWQIKVNIFWFRRDLRLEDNTGLNMAISSGLPVIAIFIFDINITDDLSPDDPRIGFIYGRLSIIDRELRAAGSSLGVFTGEPVKVIQALSARLEINSVYANKDYEPYARQRDNDVESVLKKLNINFFRYKDQVIFEESEIRKSDNQPYSVFTPYKNRWIQKINYGLPLKTGTKPDFNGLLLRHDFSFPSLDKIGFKSPGIAVRPFDVTVIHEYDKYRDFPSADRTTYLSPHLRFGTVSIRQIVNQAFRENPVFLGELIWREFFMQILYHFPDVVSENFKKSYNNIQWRNNEKEFIRWCDGQTGYPMVDAGMRQLNETGYMHGRVRMITAGFLVRHLLIDWRWGEAYFARKLLDYELSSNNGNWQWVAGTGCDAVPYFRIFNPETQRKKFDPHYLYVKKWVTDFGKHGYPEKIVDHQFAHQRAISAYKEATSIRFKNP